MTDAYQNRIATAAPRAAIWCDWFGFLPRLQLAFLAPRQIAPPVESMLFEAAGG